jgi:hypothetical protein
MRRWRYYQWRAQYAYFCVEGRSRWCWQREVIVVLQCSWIAVVYVPATVVYVIASRYA